MANTKKYEWFRDWLRWVNQKGMNTAKSETSYLRRLEEVLVIPCLGANKSFASIHKVLTDIDNKRISSDQIHTAVEYLSEIYSLLKTELNNSKNNPAQQLSEANDMTLKGWMRAFNNYLRYLSDVTKCFTPEYYSQINDKIGIGGSEVVDAHGNPIDEEIYSKRLKLFICGVYKTIVDKIGMENVIDNILDAFSEAVDLTLKNGNTNQVPIQFLTANDNGDKMPWRSWLLDEIHCFDIPVLDKPREIPYNVHVTKSPNDIREILMEIFSLALRTRDDYADIFRNNKNGSMATEEKDTFVIPEQKSVRLFNTTGHLESLIKEYAAGFKLEFTM